MLAGLPEPLGVNLHRLRQAGDLEVPLVGQPVSPTLRLDVGLELLGHHLLNVFLVSRAVEIKIIAQVWPVVERLHDRCLATSGFQLVANAFQSRESVHDPSALFFNRSLRPFDQLGEVHAERTVYQRLQGPNDDVIAVCQ